MGFIKSFVSEYGMTIIYAALTVIGVAVKKIYGNHTADDTKKKVVETCVKAVEQIYSDLHGAEKLEKAKENIVAMLQAKEIEISDIEMDMLIEACVSEFNINFRAEAKAEAKKAVLDKAAELEGI